MTEENQIVPDSEAELKEKANRLYASRNFSESASLYTKIIDEFASRVPLDFLRVIRCNRAACFIELGQYTNAIKDLQLVLQENPGGTKAEAITRKAHFRLARALFKTFRHDEALKEINQYRDMVGGQPEEVEQNLRADILNAITTREKNKVDQETANPSESVRPVRYEVIVFNHDGISKEVTFVKQENALISLCCPHPPEEATKTFVTQLVLKYDKEIMSHQAWKCWMCGLPATSITHSPASYLYLPDPHIIDYAQPVCMNRGPCDLEARSLVGERMKELMATGK